VRSACGKIIHFVIGKEPIESRSSNPKEEKCMTESTLYQRVGGEAAINAAVDRFYERILADASINHFFRGISMGRLKAHQFAFLSLAVGGPKQYSGVSMSAAHAKLAIEQSHFDSVAVHLVETLRELGVSEEVIHEVAEAVTPLANQIVNTQPTSSRTALA
jgi:hemoglobin